MGLVDATSTPDGLVGDAVAMARQRPVRPTGAAPVRLSPPTRWRRQRHPALAKARGQIAPGEAARLIATADRPLAEGLADERATFVALRDGEQSRALRHVFFAERAAQKVEDLDGVAPRKVETIGIVGLVSWGRALPSLP